MPGKSASPAFSLRTRLSRISRSEEHTSELQSQSNLVCRLLLEKKKTTTRYRLIRSELVQPRHSPMVRPLLRQFHGRPYVLAALISHSHYIVRVRLLTYPSRQSS